MVGSVKITSIIGLLQCSTGSVIQEQHTTIGLHRLLNQQISAASNVHIRTDVLLTATQGLHQTGTGNIRIN